jgi:outer membrane protein assembly factor BamA
VLGDEAILHPSKRMYAGGSQSVRGFGENELGPRVLTVDPAKFTARSVTHPTKTDSVVTAACPANTAAQLRACFASRADHISDNDFAERPLGGTSLLLGSIELRVPIWGPLIAAAFVDGAVLGEKSLGDFDHSTSAATPGFGVRYLSPVGPVRVDVGFRPKLTESLPVLSQLTDSTGSRVLVDLTNGKGCKATSTAADGCRRFPLRESDSAFRRFLDRLTLHLSIGEAF